MKRPGTHYKTMWQPLHAYDLITCVHGLHYIGDKLGLVTKCLANLTEGGTFTGNLDLKSLEKPDGSSWDRHVAKMLKGASVHYHSGSCLIASEGKRELSLRLVYEGADDRAGKNYTGQEAFPLLLPVKPLRVLPLAI